MLHVSCRARQSTFMYLQFLFWKRLDDVSAPYRVVSVVEHGHTALEGAPSRAQRTGMGCTPLLHTVLLGWLVVERQLTTPRIAMMWYGNGVYSSTELGHIWCTKILNLNNPNVFLHTCVHYFTFDHRPLHGEMIVQADEIGVHP